MVESSKIHRIQGCEATFTSPTAGSPQIDGRNPALPRAGRINPAVPTRTSVTPCSPPSRRGLATMEFVAPARRRPSLTAAARGVTGPWQGRDEETALRSNKETGQDRKKAKGRSKTSKKVLDKKCPIQG